MMDAQTKSLIQKIVLTPENHARWLNTLSFLEHIGSRKIIKSQKSEKLDLMVLEHIAEETRHAFYIKKLAQKISPDTCPTYEEDYLLAGNNAEKYFQQLDQKISEILSRQYAGQGISLLTYLYVTLLVEERAIGVYRVYETVLEENHFAISVKPILAEEQRHLKQMRELLSEYDAHYEVNHKQFQDIECTFYHLLMEQLNAVVH